MMAWASLRASWSISDPIFEGFWSSQLSRIVKKHKVVVVVFLGAVLVVAAIVVDILVVVAATSPCDHGCRCCLGCHRRCVVL